MWKHDVFSYGEYSRTQSESGCLLRHVYLNMTVQYCTRDFTEMYRELYGLSYPGIMWPLPSEAKVRSQGTRMAFSNIDGESVEGMKSN